MSNKKFQIASLGCRTNQYESEAFRKQLSEVGLMEGDDADICIVNTCTVTASADQKSISQIRALRKKNPRAKIIVTGCLAEREKKKLEALDGVEMVIPNNDKQSLIQYLFPDLDTYPEFSIEQFEAHTRAFVKIQDGCNSYCSYCIIPFVRGRSRSKKVSDILKEIETLIEKGYREIVLTGINIGDFDGGGDSSLAELVRLVDQIEGLERLRISSIDPDEVDDALLSAVIEGKKTCHSMHIVLQSGSNQVLERMRRKYTMDDFYSAVDRLRGASSDFTFTTDVIVGFPGETEDEFEESLEAIRNVGFAKVHMFPYSDRPKTRASRMPDKVSDPVKTRRKQILMAEAVRVAHELREKYLGRKMAVLLESPIEGTDNFSGHTENFLPVIVEGENLRSNEIVEVQLRENTPKGLKGRVL